MKRQRQIADRLFLISLSFVCVIVSFREPESLSYTLLRIGGFSARMAMGALLILSCIALLDTIVNDMMPERFSANWALRLRQGIWMVICVTYIGLAFVIVRYGVGYWLAVVYVLYGLRCGAVSYLDLYYEYRDQIAERQRELGKDPSSSLSGAISDE